MAEDCLFCKIIRGETDTEFLYEDDTMVVFKDKYPHTPVHLLIVPRKHIRSINDLNPEDEAIIGRLVAKSKEMAETAGVNQSGYKLLFNVERGGGQVIFHVHLHLMGGWDEYKSIP